MEYIMRRLVSAFIAIMLVVSTLGIITFADDGMILWTDGFESGEMNPNDWIVEGSLFTVEEYGPTNSWHLESWGPTNTQQTTYGEYGNGKLYDYANNFICEVKNGITFSVMPKSVCIIKYDEIKRNNNEN